MHLSYSTLARALALLLLPLGTALAQTPGVGIGTTAPDASAALDIVSSSKGALLPRVASAAALAAPATGLLVFQTGAPAGFYYNAGTPAAPSWQQLATAAGAAVTAGNGLTKTGQNIALGGTALGANTDVPLAGKNLTFSGTGNVGIGTTSPAHPLTVQASSSNSMLGFSDNTGTDKYNFSRTAPTGSGASAVPGGLNLSESNVAGGRLYVQDGTGSVGLGTTAPNAAAALDVTSSTRGFLPPRLSQTQRDAIASPAAGLQVYNTSSARLNVWNGTAWAEVIAGTVAPSLAPVTYTYTGGPQTYTVPAGMSLLKVTAVGAGGGTFYYSAPGGQGGTVTATVPVTAGETLTLFVGGRGNDQVTSGSTAGGYNGGGAAPGRYAGSGGGATDLRRGAALAGRLVVAGGGGGSASYPGGGAGGNPAGAGGSNGAVGGGGGGTQAGGGSGGSGTYAGQAGTLGQGGAGGVSGLYGATDNAGSGGGGGYYGGGGGGSDSNGANRASGGGGSSWAVAGASAVSYQTGGNAGNGSLTLVAMAQPAPVLDGANIVNLPEGPWTQNGDDVYRTTGNVGIGTSSPTQKLDVAGSTRLRGLTTPGVVTTDAQGNLSSQAAPSGTNFIVNGTAQQAGSFNVSGSGTVGSLVAGTASVANQLVAGQVVGGQVVAGNNFAPTATLDVAGSTRLRGLTTPGVVTTDAQGNLSSQAPTTYSGTDFVQNQTSADQAGGFRLAGGGALGGSLGVGSTATPAQRLSVVSADNTASTDIVKVTSLNGASGVSLGYFGLRASGSNADDRLTLDAKGAGHLLLQTGGGTGNVGLGTSAPNTRLSISPSTTEAKITLYDGGSTTGHYGFGVSGNQLNYHVLSTSDRHVFWATGKNGTGTELMRIQGDGKVGIGTNSPVAPLHVSGNASVAASGTKAYFYQGSGTTLASDASTAARPVVAYFTGGQLFVNDYIVAGALTTTSDRRIKRVLGLSDRTADLALLNRLRITDYTYIDQHANTDKVVKKVIAQEVQQVLPAAISQSRQAIPNVYERATAVRYANGQITLTTAKPHELPAGGGTLRLYTPQNQELSVAATVVDAHTVRFASAEAYAEGLFVYGKYVDDFLSVDYDALTTLNVSATQELARKVEALEKQNAALQAGATADHATLQQVQRQAAADHAALQTMQEQLARLLNEAPAGAQARK